MCQLSFDNLPPSPQAPHPSPNALFQRGQGQTGSTFQRLCATHIFYLFEINKDISVNTPQGIFSLKRCALQSIRPVVSRKKRVFSARLGPDGAVPPPRIVSFSKIKRSKTCPKTWTTEKREQDTPTLCMAVTFAPAAVPPYATDKAPEVFPLPGPFPCLATFLGRFTFFKGEMF